MTPNLYTVLSINIPLHTTKEPTLKKMLEDDIGSTSHSVVNTFLRKTKGGTIPHTQTLFKDLPTYTKKHLRDPKAAIDHINALDNYLDLHNVKHSGGTLYRVLGNVSKDKFKEGKSYTHHGYTNTSMDKEGLDYVLKKTMPEYGVEPSHIMKFKVPPNYPAFNVKGIAQVKEENEAFLPRGMRFSVTKVVHSKNKPSIVHATVLPYKKPEPIKGKKK